MSDIRWWLLSYSIMTKESATGKKSLQHTCHSIIFIAIDNNTRSSNKHIYCRYIRRISRDVATTTFIGSNRNLEQFLKFPAICIHLKVAKRSKPVTIFMKVAKTLINCLYTWNTKINEFTVCIHGIPKSTNLLFVYMDYHNQRIYCLYTWITIINEFTVCIHGLP
jgi:hypothetical protein